MSSSVWDFGQSQAASLRAWFRENGAKTSVDATINVLLPLLLYYGLKEPGGASLALVASSVPPLLACITSFVSTRRLDALSIFAIVSIALSLLALSGPPTALGLALGQKAGRMVLGVAFLGSAALGRPLIAPLAHATVARESPTALARYETLRGSAHLHRTLMVMTLVWSGAFLGDVILSVWMIFHMSGENYAALAPLLGYGTPAALMGWTIAYRRSRRRMRSGPEVGEGAC